MRFEANKLNIISSVRRLMAAIASLSLYKELIDKVVPSNQEFDSTYCGKAHFYCYDCLFNYRFKHIFRISNLQHEISRQIKTSSFELTVESVCRAQEYFDSDSSLSANGSKCALTIGE